MKKIEVLGLQTIPKIKEGDNLAEIIVKCVEDENWRPGRKGHHCSDQQDCLQSSRQN